MSEVPNDGSDQGAPNSLEKSLSKLRNKLVEMGSGLLEEGKQNSPGDIERSKLMLAMLEDMKLALEKLLPGAVDLEPSILMMKASLHADAIVKSEPAVDRLDDAVRRIELQIEYLFPDLTDKDREEIVILLIHSGGASMLSLREQFKSFSTDKPAPDDPRMPQAEKIYMQGMDRFLDSGVYQKLSVLQKKILATPPYGVQWR